MGDYDFVPEVMEINGFQILFNRVAVKPGKPTTFAVSKERWCFGVPGNPVSAFIVFEIFIKPFLYHLMGSHFIPIELELPLEEEFRRHRIERDEWIPVKISKRGAKQLRYHGSGHIHALSLANGIALVPKGVHKIDKGEKLNVRPL